MGYGIRSSIFYCVVRKAHSRHSVICLTKRLRDLLLLMPWLAVSAEWRGTSNPRRPAASAAFPLAVTVLCWNPRVSCGSTCYINVIVLLMVAWHYEKRRFYLAAAITTTVVATVLVSMVLGNTGTRWRPSLIVETAVIVTVAAADAGRVCRRTIIAFLKNRALFGAATELDVARTGS